MRLVDLTGERFDRLVVVGRAAADVKVKWVCRCDCGKETEVFASALTSGHTLSCGCRRSEVASARATKRNRKELVSYDTAHRRIHKDRGRPGHWPCVGCAGVATDWAYDGTDPDELVQETVVNGTVLHRLTYSLKPEHYSPKCRKCNNNDKRLRIET